MDGIGKEFGIIILYVIGMALAIAEIFLPGVVIGLIGLVCVSTSIYMAFAAKASLGWLLLGITVASVPFLITLWVKVLNRFLAMKHTEAGYSGADAGEKDLLGKEGVTITMLRPAGMAKLGEKKVDVVSEGDVIEANTRVSVVEVRGNRVVVRAIKA